jgi:hypothetical protein
MLGEMPIDLFADFALPVEGVDYKPCHNLAPLIETHMVRGRCHIPTIARRILTATLLYHEISTKTLDFVFFLFLLAE